MPRVHFFRRAPAASSSVQSTSHWVAVPHYFVREGGTFYTEMTGSFKTDQTQRACMLDYVARHPSVHALPDLFSSCFVSAGTSFCWLLANSVGWSQMSSGGWCG